MEAANEPGMVLIQGVERGPQGRTEARQDQASENWGGESPGGSSGSQGWLTPSPPRTVLKAGTSACTFSNETARELLPWYFNETPGYL